MNGAINNFWNLFDKNMEELNNAYLRMYLATTPKQFDTAFSDYVSILKRITERSLVVYDSITSEIVERGTDND